MPTVYNTFVVEVHRERCVGQVDRLAVGAAVATKYAGLLFVPTIFGLFLWRLPLRSWSTFITSVKLRLYRCTSTRPLFFFAAPLAGCGVEQLVNHHRSELVSYRTGLEVAVSSILLLRLWQAHSLYHRWASSTAMVRMLTTEIKQGNDRYLAEDFNVSSYYLREMTNPWQWTSLDYFTYTDRGNHQHAGEDAH
jgi:hypothetical protein